MNNYSDIKIGKLIHQMKIHQSNVNDGITLFLGAGCSLASSQKDISTWGIVHDIVKNHLGNTSDTDYMGGVSLLNKKKRSSYARPLISYY